MSSLKFIMDVDIDHDDQPRNNKKGGGSFVTTSGTRAPDPSAYERQAASSGQGTHNTTSPSLIPVTRILLPTVTTDTARSHTTPTAISAIIDGPPPSLPPPRTQLVTLTLPSRQPSAETGTYQTGSTGIQSGPLEATSLSARPAALRRHSTTSASTMDQHSYSPLSPIRLGARAGPGRAASLGGIADSSAQASGVPNRPMAPQAHLDSPIRLTPITGRISRARKGQPVHVCDICRPAKTFTRAEHLRRHQLGHGTPQFPCLVPGCDRTFHRADLLARHQQKHQEGDSACAPPREGPGRDGSSPGGGSGRRSGQQTYSGNPRNVVLRPHEGQSSGASENASGSGSGSGPGGTRMPASSADMPSTPNATRALLLQQSFGSSPAGNPSLLVSPHDVTRRNSSIEATASRRISNDFASTQNSAYTLSPSALNNPTIRLPTISATYNCVPAPVFNRVSYQSPREQRQLCVVTEGLSDPSSSLHVPDAGIPDLSMSPMYQSSTDGSTYSTPSDPRALHAPWTVPRQSSPQLYQGLSVETTSSETWTAPYVYSHEQQSPTSLVSPPIFSAYAEFGHSYGFLDDSIATSYPAMHQADHLQLAIMDENSAPASGFSADSQGDGRLPDGIQMRSRTSLGGPLVTPAPVLSREYLGISSGAGQHKAMMAAAPSPGITATVGGGFSSSHGAGYGFGSGDDGNAGSNGLANPWVRGGCANAPVSLTAPLPRHVHHSMPTYEGVYWDTLDPECPFVHRRMSSDEVGESVLRSAMAAVGAQCLGGLEHGARSDILHKHAWEEARRIPRWNIQIMQAILLCEYLTRFRGKRLVIQPSKPFESLYSRAINQAHALPDPAPTAQSSPHLTTQQRWHAWLAKESYRRLASSCFALDVHASLYHQVSCTRDLDNVSKPGSALPLTTTGPSQALWDASSAEEWDRILKTNPAAGGEPKPMLPSEAAVAMLPKDGSSLTTSSGQPWGSFDHLLILAAETQHLPKRDLGSGTSRGNSTSQSRNVLLTHAEQHASDWKMLDQTPPALDPASDYFVAQLGVHLAAFKVENRIASQFRYSPIANTYLALHHTPLHSLLAVTGSPGNFYHKSLAHHQDRVQLWTAPLVALDESFSKRAEPLVKLVSRAIVYAARALTLFLSSTSARSVKLAGLSDYWGIYVCTLICWACGIRAAATIDASSCGNPFTTAEQDAREWLNLAASLQPADDEAVSNVIRDGRWAGVISLAYRQIDQDCYPSNGGNVMSDVLAVLTRLDGDFPKKI